MTRRCVALLFVLLSSACGSKTSVSQTTQPLDPSDFVPPTTYTVKLSVQVPATPAYTVKQCNGGRICCQGAGCGPCSSDCVERGINFTPVVEWLGTDPRPDNLSPDWFTTAVMGVRVNSNDWSSDACLLGNLYYAGTTSSLPLGADLPCAVAFTGGGPDLNFDTVGNVLSRTFQINTATDNVSLVAMLDDTGALDGDPSSGLTHAIGMGLGTASNVLKVVSVVGGTAGKWIGGIGSYLGYLVSVLAYLPQLDQSEDPQANAKRAQRNCLGGMLGNPPSGSMTPQDQFNAVLTGQQLYDGTRNGPMNVTLHARMNYQPSLDPPPQGWCMAATDVSFVIDRAGSYDQWTDGLAFQPRSADSAVVRRANAVDSFRVGGKGFIEHDSWQYAPPETSLHPSDGLALCNGPGACSPTAKTCELISRSNYQASPADPNKQRPPTLTRASTPMVALAPDPDRLRLFYVDDAGGLYVSVASVSGDTATWTTWLVNSHLPPNAPIAVLNGTRLGDELGHEWYNVFWAGLDGTVDRVTLDVANGPSSPPLMSTGQAVPTGAAIAAVSRRPNVADVFVVGDAVWHLSGTMLGLGLPQGWTSEAIGPSTGVVAPGSPVTAVATTINNLDVFYFDRASHLQHVAWTQQVASNTWDLDASLGNATVGSAPLALSAVSRTPNNVDVVYPCNGSAVCDVSLLVNSYASIPQFPAPPITTSPTSLDGPLSIVAASSSALDVVASSDSQLYDVSWQRGAAAWGTGSLSPDQCACVPSCSGKSCGDDGCGGSCGTCAAGLTCQADQCVCIPSCAGKSCGSDGCGGSCGGCADNQLCTSGQCCTPTHDCTGRCGYISNGCGGTLYCGACNCTPSCYGKACGASDGCGGHCQGYCKQSKIPMSCEWVYSHYVCVPDNSF